MDHHHDDPLDPADDAGHHDGLDPHGSDLAPGADDHHPDLVPPPGTTPLDLDRHEYGAPEVEDTDLGASSDGGSSSSSSATA